GEARTGPPCPDRRRALQPARRAESRAGPVPTRSPARRQSCAPPLSAPKPLERHWLRRPLQLPRFAAPPSLVTSVCAADPRTRVDWSIFERGVSWEILIFPPDARHFWSTWIPKEPPGALSVRRLHPRSDAARTDARWRSDPRRAAGLRSASPPDPQSRTSGQQGRSADGGLGRADRLRVHIEQPGQYRAPRHRRQRRGGKFQQPDRMHGIPVWWRSAAKDDRLKAQRREPRSGCGADRAGAALRATRG